MENIQKSITMLINETREKLVQTCNTSNLPPCVLELILQNLYNEVSALAKRQLQEDELYYVSATMPDNVGDVSVESVQE